MLPDCLGLGFALGVIKTRTYGTETDPQTVMIG